MIPQELWTDRALEYEGVGRMQNAMMARATGTGRIGRMRVRQGLSAARKGWATMANKGQAWAAGEFSAGAWHGADGKKISQRALWKSDSPLAMLQEAKYTKPGQRRAFDKWGKGVNPEKFFGRGAAGHLFRGASNTVKNTGSAFAMGALGGGYGALLGGIFLHGGAMGMSGNNVASPYDGFVRGAVHTAAGFLGFDLGMSAGAAVGATLGSVLGPAGTVIGAAVGGLAGAMGLEAASDAPWKIAEMGYAATKPFASPFLDSQRAATMRQRSMNMINQSAMNARSALSMEAAGYHL